MAPSPDDGAASWPPGITEDDAPALDDLAAAGIGEGDLAGDEAGVPTDLVELYEVLEWQRACEGPA
jgi:hypothetical protein